jgi:hypothetical protein
VTDTTIEQLAIADRKATALFSSTSIVVALVVGSMLVSGWRAGSLDNRVEWIFWVGAIIGAAGVVLFSAATWPRSPTERALRSTNRFIRIGIVLFIVAPVLCTFAVMADYWI